MEALKAILTKNGKKLAMSERTLTKNVEKIYGRLERQENEDELDVVVTEYLPDFEEINGNIQKDNSDFIKKWQTEHPSPEEKQKDAPPADGDNDKLDKLLKELGDLKKEREAEKIEKATALKKNELISSFKKKGIKDEKWLNGYIKKLSVTENTDIEAETDDALALYNITHAGTGNIHPNNAEGGENKADEQFIERLQSIAKRQNGDS